MAVKTRPWPCVGKTNSSMLRPIHHWIAFTAWSNQAAGAFIRTSKIRSMTMRKLHHVAAACAISAIMFSGAALAQATAEAAPKKEETGKDIAFNRTKGNCTGVYGGR